MRHEMLQHLLNNSEIVHQCGCAEEFAYFGFQDDTLWEEQTAGVKSARQETCKSKMLRTLLKAANNQETSEKFSKAA